MLRTEILVQYTPFKQQRKFGVSVAPANLTVVNEVFVRLFRHSF